MKTTKLVSCPKCAHPFRVRIRAEMGEGTQRGKGLKKLNGNLMLLMEIAIESKVPLHVSQFSAQLYSRNARRFVRGDKDRPTGKWNAHLIQADLSMLLGCDMLTMVPGSKNKWDDTLKKYVARPVPKYFADWLQVIRWESVMDSGDVSNFERRPASKRGVLSKEEHINSMVTNVITSTMGESVKCQQ